jgi:hypothetical protein
VIFALLRDKGLFDDTRDGLMALSQAA